MFDDPPRLKRGILRSKHDQRWRSEVHRVMDRFQRAFPEVHYDVAWRVDALNGAAWRQIKQRHVRLYGGLVRHRLIDIEGVALLFAHETGHHYGGPPRDAIYDWMTCECQADFWAARHGVPMAWNNNVAAARHVVQRGARQLLAFERSMIEAGNMSVDSEPVSLKGCLDHASPDDRYKTFLSALEV